MKNRTSLICRFFICVVSLISVPAVYAQVDEINNKVASLVAMTKPGYFKQLYVLDPPVSVDICSVPLKCLARPLPVELLSFSAERIDAGNVLVTWETASELNNDHFLIERSLNPRLGFEIAGKVAGNGTTKDNQNYQFTDKNDLETYTYYRLKQVDTDGTFEYSRIVAVKGSTGDLKITLFPNPSPAKNIHMSIAGLRQQSTADISVYDNQGKMVYNEHDVTFTPEKNVKLNLPNVPVGKYSVKISFEQRELVSSFVLIP